MMGFYIERFTDMETREFEVEVVTPLFLGSSDPAKAELRVPPIKGLIRFWWRALYGSDDLKEMKQREERIFGSTEGKASFSLYLKDTHNIRPVLVNLPPGKKIMTKSKGKEFPISIIDYLAFGLCEYKKEERKNVYTKGHIPAGSRFKLALSIKNNDDFDQVFKALNALANYGALGSHCRNGFGSIRIIGLNENIKMSGEMMPYTAFSSKAVLFDNFSEKDKWEDALFEIGKIYREARGSLEPKHSFEKRSLIAKPIIVKNEVNIKERHSKPYFLHVNKLSNGKYKGQILFIPYSYHKPDKFNEYVEVCEKMNQKIAQLTGGQK